MPLRTGTATKTPKTKRRGAATQNEREESQERPRPKGQNSPQPPRPPSLHPAQRGATLFEHRLHRVVALFIASRHAMLPRCHSHRVVGVAALKLSQRCPTPSVTVPRPSAPPTLRSPRGHEPPAVDQAHTNCLRPEIVERWRTPMPPVHAPSVPRPLDAHSPKRGRLRAHCAPDLHGERHKRCPVRKVPVVLDGLLPSPSLVLCPRPRQITGPLVPGPARCI